MFVRVVDLPTFTDERGGLTVIEDEVGYKIARVFFLHHLKGDFNRGGHGHFYTKISLVAIHGECEIRVNNGKEQNIYHLNSPDKCLVLEPEDWHLIYNISEGAVVAAVASHPYDKEDYFFKEPDNGEV